MTNLSKITNADWNVLIAYADNDMSVSKTAESMFFHRNTVEYHLNKVRDNTGQDPRCFHDLVQLFQLAKDKIDVVKCKKCALRGTLSCRMAIQHPHDPDKVISWEQYDGFCNYGVKKEGE